MWEKERDAVSETADVLDHLLVLLESLGVPLDDVLAELERQTTRGPVTMRSQRGGWSEGPDPFSRMREKVASQREVG